MKITFCDTGELCGVAGTYSVYGNRCYRSVSLPSTFSNILCNQSTETLLTFPMSAADNYFIRCKLKFQAAILGKWNFKEYEFKQLVFFLCNTSDRAGKIEPNGALVYETVNRHKTTL